MEEFAKPGTGSLATISSPTTQPSASSSGSYTTGRGRSVNSTNRWASSRGITVLAR
jgi:hypothetical protein